LTQISVQPVNQGQKLLFNGRVAELAMAAIKNLAGGRHVTKHTNVYRSGGQVDTFSVSSFISLWYLYIKITKNRLIFREVIKKAL